MADERRFDGESIVDWGVRTGRFAPERAAFWRQQLAAERGRVQASGSAPRPSTVEATIRSLHPVFADDTGEGSAVWAVNDEGHHVPVRAGLHQSRPGATPVLDQLMEDLYGPSQAERHAREDAAAERELAAAIEADAQHVAASALTDSEYRSLFPPGDDQDAGA